MNNLTLVWAAYLIATQSSDADASIGMNISVPSNDFFNLEWLRTGSDNYAAGRTVSVTHLDPATSIPVFTLASNSVDNARMHLPVEFARVDAAASEPTANLVGVPKTPHPMAGSEYLAIRGASLADGETIRLHIQGTFYCKPPTVTAVGTNVTVTENYNRVRYRKLI